MPSIRAIPTTYSGVSFRSRLEARWAVFFDALGIEWEYEPQGYVLPSGDRYLPDFWLPKFEKGCYVEVKPFGGDFSKGREFAKAANVGLWLAAGVPHQRLYEFLYPAADGKEWSGGAYWGIPLWDQAHGENRMYVNPGVYELDGVVHDDSFNEGDHGGLIRKAINAAKSARFGS